MNTAPTETPHNFDDSQQPSFRHLLQETDTFLTCVEMVTSRGTITDSDGEWVLELAQKLADKSAYTRLEYHRQSGR